MRKPYYTLGTEAKFSIYIYIFQQLIRGFENNIYFFLPKSHFISCDLLWEFFYFATISKPSPTIFTTIIHTERLTFILYGFKKDVKLLVDTINTFESEIDDSR